MSPCQLVLDNLYISASVSCLAMESGRGSVGAFFFLEFGCNEAAVVDILNRDDNTGSSRVERSSKTFAGSKGGWFVCREYIDGVSIPTLGPLPYERWSSLGPWRLDCVRDETEVG